MTSAGMFITAIIIGFEIVIFACLKDSPWQAFFIWRKPIFQYGFYLKRF